MKNRFIYSLMEPLRLMFKLEVLTWSFFAAGHGKGPVDGVGGRAKRLVWQEILSRKCPSVLNAKDFFTTLSQKAENIMAILSTPMSQKDALDAIEADMLFSHAPKIPAISTDHFWIANDVGLRRDRLSREIRQEHIDYTLDLDSLSAPPVVSSHAEGMGRRRRRKNPKFSLDYVV
jgi:hypothetical protein